MSTVTITVRGQHETEIAAEICTVTASAATDGADREDVARRALAASAVLGEELEGFTDSGAVASWSTGKLQASSERPWSQNGEVLPFVHTANIALSAQFVDFDAASSWVSELSARESIRVDGVSWSLTPDTRHRVEANVASEALRDALRRAEAYARTLGLGACEPVAIADAGLLPSPATAEAAPKMFASRQADAASLDSAPLTPGRIRVAASVDAQFTAR